MPRYEYRCRACGSTFERSRPMAESARPAPCPAGHDDTVKLLSAVPVHGAAGTGGMGDTSGTAGMTGAAEAGPPQGAGGGCCGGGCCG